MKLLNFFRDTCRFCGEPKNLNYTYGTIPGEPPLSYFYCYHLECLTDCAKKLDACSPSEISRVLEILERENRRSEREISEYKSAVIEARRFLEKNKGN